MGMGDVERGVGKGQGVGLGMKTGVSLYCSTVSTCMGTWVDGVDRHHRR